MGVLDIYSKRLKRKAQAGKPDVYQYEDIPRPLRVQIIHIWASAIGPCRELRSYESQIQSNVAWSQLHDMFSRELGVFGLGESYEDPFVRCQKYLLNADTLRALDLIELTFRWLDRITRDLNSEQRQASQIKQTPDDAIEELNQRFREHGVGYSYENGEIVRIDSQYVHAEVVRPALQLLSNEEFAGPHDEFLCAHKHYRDRKYKEAINEALKSFESVMKAICTKRKWTYPPNATASKLIEVIFNHGLVPTELQGQFTSLQAVLQSGLPTVRNRNSGHGQGLDPIKVPDYLAAFALHLAAANIVLLVAAHRRGRQRYAKGVRSH